MSRVTLLNKLFSGHKIKHPQLVCELKMNLQLKHSLTPQQQNKWLIPNAAATVPMESFIVMLLFYWEQPFTFYIVLHTFSSNDLFNRINQ